MTAAFGLTSRDTLWARIERALRSEIEQGVHRPGAKLPTEQALALRFRVHRHTVRQAFSSLEQAGLVRSAQGRGRFVREGVIPYPIGRRTRFSANIALADHAPKREILKVLRRSANPKVARHLQIVAGSPVWQIECLGRADGAPICRSTHFVAAARFPAFPDRLRPKGSITAALATYAITDYVRKWTTISADRSTAAEARLLGQPSDQPTITTEAVNVDASGRPIEYGISRFASARVILVVGENAPPES
ncbi:MAG: phosphonate metabolism transcriptional regulator PhnF [Rhodospirillaceae bacterium]|nr:phosphonate metabolism transcriptional regulator PhnF [Rhodospirillaceae bacterium]